MADGRCSIACISSVVKTDCNVSSRYRNDCEVRRLSDCNRPIFNHLRQFSINSADITSEGQLIAFRCGLFDTDLSSFTVCPFHRDSLGLAWQQRAKCQYPFHEGKAKPYRSFSLRMSRLVFSSLSTLVPVGSGICRKCIDLVHNLPDNHEQTDIKNDNDNEKDISADITQRCAAYSLRPINIENCGDCTEHSDQLSSQESQHLSQTSNWSEENSLGLETLNSIVHTISNGKLSPLKYQLQKPLQDITSQSRNYIQKKASQMVHSILELVAPGQSEDLLKLMVEPVTNTKHQETENLLEILTKIYNDSTYKAVKDQTLSIMAGLTTKEDLKNRIPGLTNYHIDKVRAVTPDQIFQKVNQPPKKRQKMDQTKLEHCLSFFFSSSFHQLVSYGTRDLELDSGEIVVIPDVVRTACHSSIIEMYEKHCKDTDFSPLSRATLFRILHACSASKRRNLHGLDNITADGLAAFKSLCNILKNLELKGTIDKDMKSTLTQLLTDGQNYLKRTFKFHVSLDSACSDHCIQWACIDPKDVKFQSVCNHEHTDSCQECEKLSVVLDQMCSLNLDDDEALDVIEARNNIQAWKAHIVRTINQDRSRVDLLDTLKTSQILLVMDWAMKFLPLLHREKQSDWFGQKGISWHVTVGITKDNNGSLKHSTWVHILESGKQDWFAVASILEHTLSTVAQQYPNMKEAFLRSDNAGCYHNGFLWSSIPSISERTGIVVKRYNFSEAQAGKSYCDAKIAHLRKKMRLYVADGNDTKFPADMKMAIDTSGGVAGCQVAVVDVDYTRQLLFGHKWRDVRFITDLEIDSSLMTTRRAFDIGQGNVIDATLMVSLPQSSTDLRILSDFMTPEKQEGQIQTPSTVKEPVQCFPCSEEGCLQSFCTFEEYEEHMYFERHTFEFHQNSNQLSTFDKVKLRWAEKCNIHESEEQIIMPTALSDSGGKGACIRGWALKKEKKQVRFKQHVRNYLNDVFKTGAEVGRKANPAEVALNMRALTNDRGERIFAAQDCLKPSQIISYFSRLTSQSKDSSKQGSREIAEEEDDEYLEHIIREIEIQEIKDTVNAL